MPASCERSVNVVVLQKFALAKKCLEMGINFDFEICISTFKAPISTNKASIFNLIIEEHVERDKLLIKAKFTSLDPTEAV